MEEKIEISKSRYEELLNAETFLECLEGAGVDNWSGYEIAQEMFEQED